MLEGLEPQSQAQGERGGRLSSPLEPKHSGICEQLGRLQLPWVHQGQARAGAAHVCSSCTHALGAQGWGCLWSRGVPAAHPSGFMWGLGSCRRASLLARVPRVGALACDRSVWPGGPTQLRCTVFGPGAPLAGRVVEREQAAQRDPPPLPGSDSLARGWLGVRLTEPAASKEKFRPSVGKLT